MDHRWLLLITRIVSGGLTDVHSNAWLYHRRTLFKTGALLFGMARGGTFDASDALLVFSLLALWQRRRPTDTVRSNKGRTTPRRETAKPVAALGGSIVSPGQIAPLVRLSTGIADGQRLALVALEAALTEAHLAPHQARRTKGTEVWDGESWLRAVECALDDVSGVDWPGGARRLHLPRGADARVA
ncbi:MAG: hypothetical protein R3F61_19645 [Myxococcota bacterium]